MSNLFDANEVTTEKDSKNSEYNEFILNKFVLPTRSKIKFSKTELSPFTYIVKSEQYDEDDFKEKITSMSLYINNCYKIQNKQKEVRSFSNHIVQFENIDFNRSKSDTLLVALKANENVKAINFISCYNEHQIFKNLNYILRNNNNIVSLNLKDTKFSVKGAETLNGLLRKNYIIKLLFLSNCFISDSEFILILSGLECNNSLMLLDLSFNYCSNTSFLYIPYIMKLNISLDKINFCSTFPNLYNIKQNRELFKSVFISLFTNNKIKREFNLRENPFSYIGLKDLLVMKINKNNLSIYIDYDYLLLPLSLYTEKSYGFFSK